MLFRSVARPESLHCHGPRSFRGRRKTLEAPCPPDEGQWSHGSAETRNGCVGAQWSRLLFGPNAPVRVFGCKERSTTSSRSARRSKSSFTLFATYTEASEMWEQRPPRTVAARGETVDPVGLVGRLKKRWGATSGVLVTP